VKAEKWPVAICTNMLVMR